MANEKTSSFFNRCVYNYFEYSLPIPIYMYFFQGQYTKFKFGGGCITRMIFAAAFLAHFTRRLYENRFVHIFSKAYTPPSDLVIDCAYYWGFAAVVGYAVNFGECVEPSWTIMAWFALWLVFEYGNYSCHTALRNMKLRNRGRKNTPRSDPDYILTKMFDLVSCPNYLYEILSWMSYAVMTSSLSAAGFAVVGSIVMASWAKERHEKYFLQFTNYPEQRKALIPFVY